MSRIDAEQQRKLDVALDWFKDNGWGNDDLVRETGLSTSTISKAHSDNTGGRPTTRTYERIVKVFKEQDTGRVRLNTPFPKVYTEPIKNLMCPFDGAPMQIIRIEEGIYFTIFKCPECFSAIKVMPNFSPLLLREFPDGLEEIVEKFNIDQQKKYDEIIERAIGK